jgi:hypothetical protein
LIPQSSRHRRAGATAYVAAGALQALFAFLGALAWYLLTTAGQSTGACFGFSHYVPSAALAFVAITGLDVAAEAFAVSRTEGPRLRLSLAWRGATAACLTAIGLAAAVFFAAVVSCSGG